MDTHKYQVYMQGWGQIDIWYNDTIIFRLSMCFSILIDTDTDTKQGNLLSIKQMLFN